MIQFSFCLENILPDAVLPPPSPLTLSPLGASDTRLTAVWAHADLAFARLTLANWLAELPPDQSIRCLFTARTDSAAVWSARLAAPPTVEGLFTVRTGISEGTYFARLFGLYQLGESDVVLLAPEGADPLAAAALLTGWAAYRLDRAPRREPARWDKPFPWGYWIVSFADAEVGDADFWAHLRDLLDSAHLRDAFDERMSAPSPKVLMEVSDMDLVFGDDGKGDGEGGLAMELGVGRALACWSTQRATERRLGVPGGSSPSGQDAVGYCDRILTALEQERDPECFAYREPARGPIDSGWRVGCLDPDHAHDEQTLRLAPLSRLSRIPGFFAYFGLPVGWVVTFEEGGFWVQAPTQDTALLDEGARV